MILTVYSLELISRFTGKKGKDERINVGQLRRIIDPQQDGLPGGFDVIGQYTEEGRRNCWATGTLKYMIGKDFFFRDKLIGM